MVTRLLPWLEWVDRLNELANAELYRVQCNEEYEAEKGVWTDRKKHLDARVVNAGMACARLRESLREELESALRQASKMHGAALQRAEAAEHEIERLKSGDAWQLLSRQLENALAEVAAVVQWHLNRNDEDGCCEDGLLCSLGQLLAPEVKR
jgi:hypothetical protein